MCPARSKTQRIRMNNKQTLSAFEGNEAAWAEFVEGLETEAATEEKGGNGAGGGHDHHHGRGHGGGGKEGKGKQHRHASLGFNSIGLEIKDGPLDWAMCVGVCAFCLCV